MEKIVWDEKFNIGVEVVDKAHAKLFRIMRKLIEISEDAEANQHVYKEGIKYLETYSMAHFLEEEAYMRSIRYKHYNRHKQIHENFREKTLVSLKKDLELSGYSQRAVQHFVSVMSNWLTEHIMREDQAIVGKATIREDHNVSSQLSIISKFVNRAMSDVLQTEARLVMADYKGQNIGHCLYCRQFYDVEGGIRMQILLGVEDSLFLRGVKRIQKGGMADGETLRVFNELFQSIAKSFKIEKEYELNKDSLMTSDGFRADFMKGYPCRLLFNSKFGYFIFCYRSWRVKQQKAEEEKAQEEDKALV